jgi:hypothetical protein
MWSEKDCSISRTKKNTFALISDFASRANGGKPPKLFTTDGYAPYADALLEVYGEEVIPERTGKRGRPRKLYKVPPEDLLYAAVHKHRRKGKVVDVTVTYLHTFHLSILRRHL